MKTKRKQSVLIPAFYPGEVTPDEAIDARAFFVLRIKLFASDAKGNKSVAEQRNAYFLNSESRHDAADQAKQLGWGVELEVAEFVVDRNWGKKPDSNQKSVGKWLRFMFRMTEAERGLLGRVLSGILYGHNLACFVEPWPEEDYAVYVKAEADNAKLVMRLTKEAGLTPVSAVEVDGL